MAINTDAVLRGYITCALWSSNDESDESGGEPLDSNYSASDLAPATLRDMRADVERFVSANRSALTRSGLSDEQIGHDLWLTRNHHGAGFWDRGLPRVLGERLTNAAHKMGGSDLYVGDDGRLHV